MKRIINLLEQVLVELEHICVQLGDLVAHPDEVPEDKEK